MKTEASAEPTEEAGAKKEENVIFIGRKPTMSYVLACMTVFQQGEKETTLKARGRAINIAVDVAEILRNRFLTDLKVKKISIGTDQVPRMQGEGSSNVSTIEITLAK